MAFGILTALRAASARMPRRHHATTAPIAPSIAPDRLGVTASGIFIDADNVSHRCAEKALAVARDRGERNLCCIRAYKDWSKEPDNSNMIQTCDRMGIEQIQVNRASGKNSSDIKMCVDIMRLLHTTDMHRFILVTADSDFRHVLLEIRNAGRVGCVYHGGPNRNQWLSGYADEYVMLEADDDARARAKKMKAPTRGKATKPAKHRTT